MSRALVLLLCLSLTGCVTITMPTTPPQASPPVADRAATACRPFVPPQRRAVPSQPNIPEQEGEYVAFLETLTERMVGYIGELREYIDKEHDAEDQALRKHQLDCQ